MKYKDIREEELKNKVAQDYFWLHDCTRIVGNVDFCVCPHQSQSEPGELQTLLWAEAKRGSADIHRSIAQLVLTIGKSRAFDKVLPPSMIGAFDAEKIAFVPYSEVSEIFYQNDFNWNVTPSNHGTKEFLLVLEKVKKSIGDHSFLYYFGQDDRELKYFIKENFVVGRFGQTKTRIDKNNFIIIYNKWLQAVKPSIAVDWALLKKAGIIDGDFYLADLLSQENFSLKEKLFVLLKKDFYELDRKINEIGLFNSAQTGFTDNQKAHTQFWNKYERPPKTEYWDYIVERRDLLVPQDVRERKGSFFTPQIWVELSQRYLTDLLGVDWQDEYYIWDCAAGTGNLLAGLTNKYNVWASTLDKQDVEVMRDRIENGANLLEDHVFQFDFLNDDFAKLPAPLQKIINDPVKRKKLVIYINPPYAEVSSKAEKGKVGVNLTKTHSKYTHLLGTAGRELYAQFFIRIFYEMNGCRIAEFSKTKALQGAAFVMFRNIFEARLEKCFLMPADTFDNVNGQFSIGFKIWNTSIKEKFEEHLSDVFDKSGKNIGTKKIVASLKSEYINKWINLYKTTNENAIGYMDGINGNDFQHNNIVYVLNSKEQLPNPRGIWIDQTNLVPVSVYFAVRRSISTNWLNERDQFLMPTDNWKDDLLLQSDSLAFLLFSNNIQSQHGTNHWIPFTEYEVSSREKFDSNFMTKFIDGKISNGKVSEDLFGDSVLRMHEGPFVFSEEAQAVFLAGKELWRYYHKQPNPNVNASLYDIKAYFQGRNDKGVMRNKSEDSDYNELMTALRDKLELLALCIEPKIYKYGFLKI